MQFAHRLHIPGYGLGNGTATGCRIREGFAAPDGEGENVEAGDLPQGLLRLVIIPPLGVGGVEYRDRP